MLKVFITAAFIYAKVDILKNQENLKNIQSTQSLNPKGITSLAISGPSQFCKDQIQKGVAIPSDGSQQKSIVTCSSLALGVLPTLNKMVSTLITEPVNKAVVDASIQNSVKVSTRNMVSGFFSVMVYLILLECHNSVLFSPPNTR